MPTTTNTEPGRLALSIIEGSVNEGRVRTDYSGRGMYGETCVAVVTDEAPEALMLRIGIELGQQIMSYEQSDDADCAIFAAQDVIERVRTDSMGRDSTVVYWPSLRVAS